MRYIQHLVTDGKGGLFCPEHPHQHLKEATTQTGRFTIHCTTIDGPEGICPNSAEWAKRDDMLRELDPKQAALLA